MQQVAESLDDLELDMATYVDYGVELVARQLQLVGGDGVHVQGDEAVDLDLAAQLETNSKRLLLHAEG